MNGFTKIAQLWVRTGKRLVGVGGLFVLTACAGGEWPNLADVQRPRESETYAVPAPSAGAPATETPAPPPSEAAAPLTADTLDKTRIWLDAAIKVMTEADRDYGLALGDFLAVADDGEALEEAWAVAQYRLTRLSAAVDDVMDANDKLAALGLGAGADTPAELSLALAQALERAGTVLAGWDRALLIENNRLAILTPVRDGAPGPNAVAQNERPAFIRINLSDARASFASELASPVNSALEAAVDLRFDVIAAGADRAQAQANLRRVTAALLKLGVPRGQLVIGLEPDETAAARVEIYLRAKSA